MSKLSDWLDSIGACDGPGEAVEWAEKYETLSEAWSDCSRADWLLWLAGKMADEPGWPTRQEVVLAACDCIEIALKYIPDGDERPRIAIETARKWACGDESVSLDDVRVAAADAATYHVAAAAAYSVAAAAAYHADAATYHAAAAAATYHAAAAAYSVAAATYHVAAAAAYSVAAAAAAAAAYHAAAADADADAAKTDAHKEMTTIIRRRLKPGRMT
jgi:hypothetical protein